MPIQYFAGATFAPTRSSFVLLSLALVLGCSPRPVFSPVTASLQGDSLILSRSPNEITATGNGVQELKVLFDVGGSSTDVGYPIDVEELPDGRIVALDRETIGLEVLDPDGHTIGRYGREGDGPGELRSPIGLTRTGGMLVISGMRKDRALTILDTAGHSLRHFPPPVAGDWQRATQRFSLPGTDFPWYPAREDVALRLVSFDDSSVAILVAGNEWTSDPDPVDPERMPPRAIEVIRVSIKDGSVLDTLWSGRTPEAWRAETDPRAMPEWEFPAYAPWPHLASGSGWQAISDGESGTIKVDGTASLSTIEWSVHPTPIDDQIKATNLDWYVRQMTRYSDSWASWWDSLGTNGRAEARKDDIARHRWAPQGPEVTTLLGFGRCLWIAGFSPEDDPTAVSRNWIVIDVGAGKLLGAVRVPDPWFRLRSVGKTGVFATYRDDEGSSHIVKLAYPEGFDACGH